MGSSGFAGEQTESSVTAPVSRGRQARKKGVSFKGFNQKNTRLREDYHVTQSASPRR